MVFALAVLHHLAIANNLPFKRIAEFISQVGRNALIEFVPKTDSQVRKMLASRQDIFTDYNEVVFEATFSKYFSIFRKAPIRGSERVLYMMVNKSNDQR